MSSSLVSYGRELSLSMYRQNTTLGRGFDEGLRPRRFAKLSHRLQRHKSLGRCQQCTMPALVRRHAKLLHAKLLHSPL